MSEVIKVPDIGGEGEVIEILVQVGDRVEVEQSLVTLESDKASMELPSPKAGVIKAIKVKLGDSLSEGDELIELDIEGGEQPADEKPEEAAKAEQPAKQEAAAPAPAEKPAPKKAGSSVQSFTIPDIGDGTARVIELMVQVGDKVEAEQSLLTLESDKASMEIPAPASGVIESIEVKMDQEVKTGDLMMHIRVEGEGEAEEEAAQEPAKQETAAPAPAQKPAPKKAESSVQSFNIPDIGDGSARVIELMVQVGDKVEAEQSLLTLESDKASMEIPAPAAGVIEAIEVKLEQEVKAGDLMLRMRVEGEAEEAEQAPAAEQTREEVAAAPAKEERAPAPAAKQAAPAPVGAPSRGNKKVHAGPAVRKLAREFGVELTDVSGSGPRNRILKEDVQSFVQSVMRKSKETGGAAATGGAGIPQVPEVDFSRFGEVELKDMTRLQQIGASNLHRSWLNVPHVTQFDLADISELEDFRKAQKAVAEKAGVKLTVLPFLLKACAHLLREQPNFNVSLAPNGKQLIQKNYVHIGFAVDTPDGLLVAVIRDVDKKSLLELAAEAAELADKARNKKLSANDMQGACFTISSLGHIGGTYFTPIVNTPEVAILGVSRATMQPVWDGKAFQPKLMLPLSLSYDHRAINGAAAALFTKRLGELLGDIRSMLL
ncbi:dihydrolipoyllysine-residue acetyltransferase [Halopseudomonas bauzanensis]|uniref:Acetyltransferase component of pyruvate dehydrogenase complex n=1 Tax=Halopseudomonas bauzanensis TaxID=653930 RepID=A0A1I4PIE0_9GAMM|nr:dihydrolipoyllysine-residue acetyltransferase [Halopseudomonas bauzanensis]SES23541.1 pyruvate dehydrogenase E2 component (dihydrolipoamide acetyltransferase) [Halopseudomonas bauzanensis]SFM27193.1 pyruvate dehydrogenase E2 component (dihydrolipoamide acetyltransferase) [Halopseudomonas bauzanensis]